MKRIVITILAAALILFGASYALQGVTEDNAEDEHLMLLPESESIVVVPYDGEDDSILSIHKSEDGYIIETVTDGYADEIRMLVSVNYEGEVIGLMVEEAHETFGLGSNAVTDEEFLSQFLNQTGHFEIAVDEADAFSSATGTVEEVNGETVEIDGITGATVTSKAIARSVNSAVGYVTGADVVSSATTWGG